jgi:phosphoribosyl 1,2-cyclic phosphodiesterase
MIVRFFGVRGSTPTPGPSTVRYGGNTVCVEVRLADGTILIFDAGTGIRELGKQLAKEGSTDPVNILFTHVHWDHIIGIPFFAPLWRKGAQINVFPFANRQQEVVSRRKQLFDGVHFPVRGADIPADMNFLEPDGDEWRVGSARIRRIALNHPGGAQGFRIDDDDGKSLAYLTDNELSPPGPAETSMDDLARFSDECDMLIHDAQYVQEDMPAKHGWGHSVSDDVLELGRRARTKHLVFFHHEPERDDQALDALGHVAGAWMREQAPWARVTVAHEGWNVTL